MARGGKGTGRNSARTPRPPSICRTRPRLRGGAGQLSAWWRSEADAGVKSKQTNNAQPHLFPQREYVCSGARRECPWQGHTDLVTLNNSMMFP